MAISPLAGKPAPKDMLVDLAQLEREYFERRPDLSDPNQLVSFGTSGHRGTPLHGTFTEAHILAITQAICDYRRMPGHGRPALHGQGHARAVRAGPAHGAGGPGGQRRGDGHPARRRRHSDPGHLPGHPRLQPRPQGAPRGRHRHHAVAQPARGRRLQVQPDQRRPGRHRRDELGPGPGQRTAARRKQRRAARAVCHGHQGGDHAPGRLCLCPTSTTCGTSSTWTPSAPPASNWAWTRSAARRCTTGGRSTNSTV